MAASETPTWILDTSSLIVVRSQTSKAMRTTMYAAMTKLVQEGRLKFPTEVVKELKRYAGAENPALDWASANAAKATEDQPELEWVATVLNLVPEVLDPDKEGTEEADPYVLAMCMSVDDPDVRVVTEDVKATGTKMALAGAAGYLGIPAVTLRVLLKFEKIHEWE